VPCPTATAPEAPVDATLPELEADPLPEPVPTEFDVISPVPKAVPPVDPCTKLSEPVDAATSLSLVV